MDTSSEIADEKGWFVYRPVVDSPFYENAYSKEHMKTFQHMMDALLSYQETFEIEEGVEWWINSCTQQEEPDMLKAIRIYQKMAKEITYDYDAVEDVRNSDVSPYRALMEAAGICQSFGPAYAYLLMEIGIDACPTGGLTEDKTSSHEWTLMKLDNQWFYADVTYENGDDGSRLIYFGMTSEERAKQGNYAIDWMNVGECNRVWRNDLEVTDDRFAGLWDIYEIKKISYDSEYVIVEGLDFNNQMKEVKIVY